MRHAVAIVILALTFTQPALAQDNRSPEQFPDVFDTQDTAEQPLTSPQEALQSFQLPAGFQVTLFASEPEVRNPIAMAWDTRGRLWIAENFTYAEHGTNFESKVRDRILVLEDSDHDGRADKRTVFWDGANKLTSIEIGTDGVWALCAPQLLFLPDRDGDDHLDGEPEVVLDGWNDSDVRHNIVNGLRWGPDGWLYGRHGILATSHVGAPGTSPDQRAQINCGIWRYHPKFGTFEVVARGTTNPWGMDWDEYGEMFFVNTVIGHLWHVLYGSHYERMYGEDFDPYLYELMPQIADHVHWNTQEVWSDVRKGVSATTDRAGGGHAHSGLMIYLGNNWPEEYRGNAFMVNLHGHRLNRDALSPRGTSYLATHKDDFIFIGDPWFRGIDLGYGPDGGVYLLDWSDIGECHENDGVHRNSGRIYKIVYGTPSAVKADLTKLTIDELIDLQFQVPPHNNEWWLRYSRRELVRRNIAKDYLDKEVYPRLKKRFRSPEPHSLRALWCWYVLGGFDDRKDEESLSLELVLFQPHMRAWAIRMLTDHLPISDECQENLCIHAELADEPLVLLTLASSLHRFDSQEYQFQLAMALSQHSELADDPYFPLLLWHGISPAVSTHPEAAVELAVKSQIPKLRQFVARRITQQIDAQPAATAKLVAVLPDCDAAIASDFLTGMSIALQGRRQAPRPEGWENIAAQLRELPDEFIQQRVRELSLVFGDGRAVGELLEIVQSKQAEITVRRDAIRALVTARVQDVEPVLVELLANRDLAVDAVRGLAALGSKESAELLVSRYSGFNPVVRAEVLQLLVSRVEFAKLLLEAIEGGKLAADDVSAFHVRQLRSLGDEDVAAVADRIWPPAASLNQAAAERIAHFGAIVRDATIPADPLRGKVLFQRACASCHVLFGEGGKVGPELTGSQRNNLQYLLENIVDPSAQVAENFRMSILVLADGRVINGIAGSETEQTITMQTPTEKLVVLKEDIEELRAANLSIMPEQLLEPLSQQEIRDLFAYLMASPAAGE